MSTIIVDALGAGALDEKARDAAQALANHDSSLSKIGADLLVLKTDVRVRPRRGRLARGQDLRRLSSSVRAGRQPCRVNPIMQRPRAGDCESCYYVTAMASTANSKPPGPDAERERVVALLRAHAEDIRARGVTRLALFGSTARGEAGPASDVDLLIEVDPHARFTLVDLARLERFLTGLLLRPIEFAFPSRLRERPRIWRRVQADALDVL